jgi:histidinol-phosphate aminotransferase
MFKLETIVRPNILTLKPYKSAREEFTGKEGVFLDANENPFGQLNRYPDPYQTELKEQLAKLKTVSIENIFIGNGSDEVIDLIFRIFCIPEVDKALTFSPTYGIYEVAAAVNAIHLIQIPLNDKFQIDRKKVKDLLSHSNLKLIFVCSPNNPSGNAFAAREVQYLLENFNGIVVIDEAYIDFSNTKSWISSLKKYPNLIISQTLSKAWGLAAARIGAAYASKEIIQLFNKIKAPYNVSELNQNAAIKALQNKAEFKKNTKIILAEKEKLITALNQSALVTKIYPSDANFLLLEVTDADKIYRELVKQKVIIRNRNTIIQNCIRITVGTTQENAQLLSALKKISL